MVQYKAETGTRPWLCNVSWAVRIWTGCERAQRGRALAGDNSRTVRPSASTAQSTAKCSSLTFQFDLPSPPTNPTAQHYSLQDAATVRWVLSVLSVSDVVPPSSLPKAVASFLSPAAAAAAAAAVHHRVTHTTASFSVLPLCSIATFGSLRDDENKEVSR